jgi:hypothetical protein
MRWQRETTVSRSDSGESVTRRLLQCLQKSVGRLLVHGVGLQEDGHPRRRLEGAQGGFAVDLPDLVDRDESAFGRDQLHVGVDAFLDASARIAFRTAAYAAAECRCKG